MSKLILLLCFAISAAVNCPGQRIPETAEIASADSVDKTGVRERILQFDQALLDQDTAALMRILHTELIFIHSNGMKQLKSDVIDDVVSGKLIYKTIEMDGLPDFSFGNLNVIFVRRTLKVAGFLVAERFSLKIRILETWKPEAGIWRLHFRQSTKLP